MSKHISFILISSILLSSACGKKAKQQMALKDEQIKHLREELNHLKGTNTSLLERLSDLSVINKTGAESIQKSIESISQQYEYIEDLTTKIQMKDSLNLTLVMNLKRSLADVDDQDVQVEVRGGVVYVSISDRMLFQSGSSTITEEAMNVLGKLAGVLNDHDDLNILVEGHTDNIPIRTGCLEDNWDLSVKRATSVVRTLQDEYFVSPERMTAGGRAEYLPKTSNEDEFGRSLNRRTEIIITPKLDQFFRLLEAPKLAG